MIKLMIKLNIFKALNISLVNFNLLFQQIAKLLGRYRISQRKCDFSPLKTESKDHNFWILVFVVDVVGWDAVSPRTTNKFVSRG